MYRPGMEQRPWRHLPGWAAGKLLATSNSPGRVAEHTWDVSAAFLLTGLTLRHHSPCSQKALLFRLVIWAFHTTSHFLLSTKRHSVIVGPWAQFWLWPCTGSVMKGSCVCHLYQEPIGCYQQQCRSWPWDATVHIMLTSGCLWSVLAWARPHGQHRRQVWEPPWTVPILAFTVGSWW